MTTTRRAPASNASFTTSATTSGFVFAAWTGIRSHPMFGFTATTSPFETNRFMPPSASMARRTSSAGSVELFAIARDSAPGGTDAPKLRTWRSPPGSKGRTRPDRTGSGRWPWLRRGRPKRPKCASKPRGARPVPASTKRRPEEGARQETGLNVRADRPKRGAWDVGVSDATRELRAGTALVPTRSER